MKQYVLWTLLFVLVHTHNHQYNCVFDHIKQDLREISAKANPDILINQPATHLPPTDQLATNTAGRLLYTPTRVPIRITLDYNAFNSSILAGTNGANSTTMTNLNFILKTMMVTQAFFQKRLRVGAVGSITAVDPCVDFSPSAAAVAGGYSDTDLVIFVQYLTDKNITYGATGKSCKYIPGGYPDVTLQVGRPTVGRIIFNTYKLVDLETTLTNRLFQSVTSTALHQTMHILGFDSTLYSTFLDSDTGNPYNPATGPMLVNSTTINSNRPKTSIITTPNVLAWARSFFGCSNLTGMPVQNQDRVGLGAGSHWQRVAMYDQLMTATSLGTAKYFSGLTFALLKDTGWYTVDDSFAETSNYGYQKGCSFVLDACYSNTSFTQFCNAATQASVSYCSSNFVGKAICSNAASLMSDSCAMYGQYFSCVDPTSPDTGNYKAKSLQVFGTNSFCVSSNMGLDALPSSLQSRCYPYVCNPNNITFTIGSYIIVCLLNETGVIKSLSGLSGSLVCPSYTSYCSMSRKMCSGFCNQNGYCTGGICNCIDDRNGSDCSRTICSAGQYYISSNGSCGNTCPGGYYANKFSASCEICKSPCSQCINSPTNCIACQTINGVIQYKYIYANGTISCSSSCPAQTYPNSSYYCLACDTTVSFCSSCSLYPTNCTSCQPGKYLARPIQNGNGTNLSCVSACTDVDYNKIDQASKVCRKDCLSYQLVSGGNCVLCTAPLFMGTGSTCVPNCTAGYYGQTNNRVCVLCDLTCLSCIGPYPENCTSCKQNTGNKFLLLQMCWPLCPKGFYADTTLGKCTLCPSNLFCSACSYDNTTLLPFCTSCIYGYFYNSTSKVCATSCLSTQYKNTWNNSCSACDTSCSTCNGPTSYSCLSCPSTFLLLTNSSGGYCLSTCPTLGYIQSGSTSCQPCDSTCSSCNGVSASQCFNCSAGYYLSSGYCRYVCPNGTYPDSSTYRCQTCDSSCSYCFGGSNSSCSSCAAGLYLYNFTCTSSCPNGMSPNQWNVCFQGWLWTHFVCSFLLLLWLF